MRVPVHYGIKLVQHSVLWHGRYGLAVFSPVQHSKSDPRSPFWIPGFLIGSGLKSGQWIRICILNPDPDPRGQKGPTKVEKNLEISCFEVLDVLF